MYTYTVPYTELVEFSLNTPQSTNTTHKLNYISKYIHSLHAEHTMLINGLMTAN